VNQKVILGHPFGNANVREALKALNDSDMLDSFVTTVCAEHLPFTSLLPSGLRSEIHRRSYKELPASKIISYPFLELLRLGAKRFGRSFPALRHMAPEVDDIWSKLDKQMQKLCQQRPAKDLVLYAYEDGAFNSFSALNHARKIYELPIGYWRSMHALLLEEQQLNPEWSPTLRGLSDSAAKLERKDMELTLADQIIVPSEFVRSTLPDSWIAKTDIVRYGCPPVIPNARIDAPSAGQSPLRVLFCGSLGQRKGISYLFESIQRMKQHVSLTVIGAPTAACPALDRSLVGVEWHKSLPRPKVLELMRDHDVFLFPTLFEGRALVVLEALSQGLPVITTGNAGAEDVVIDGVSGFIVPIRSTDAIVEALELLCSNRGLLRQMREEAITIAARTTWNSYRSNLISALTAASARV
jgi:alpha-maltose-1-phosphate synthase